MHGTDDLAVATLVVDTVRSQPVIPVTRLVIRNGDPCRVMLVP
jgi:hypothetical protein